MATRKSLVSIAADSMPFAKEDLLRNIRDIVGFTRVGENAAVVETSHSTAGDLAKVILDAPLAFPRHITDVVAEFDPDGGTLASVEPSIEELIRARTGDAEVSLQIWLSGRVPYQFNRYEAWESASQVLRDRGYRVSRTGTEYALSLCYAPKSVIVGLNRVADSLSSWPGGEVRLSKSPDQVSRAEFKLEELFKYHSFTFPANGTALDFGAAPGGWTRILAEQGLAVTAVDPGDLDRRVLALGGVRHERTTAGNFIRRSRDRFDLIVNDMKMDALMSSRLVLDSADLLKPSGLVVLTLKTGSRGVLTQINDSFALLRAKYDIEFARQLMHNRNELTVVLRKRS
ncbi:SAM-dependent methyltransferase [Glycomyces dulcitolivorans]|uniref:SAM-dependent methyltransferase n=1 Tax=Glycomyces dulcitolivorans TaxID=2200759 RepID=UPI0013007802|nr:SAM-dependent methyltransferase [Glycomyces dulcitolivorans]